MNAIKKWIRFLLGFSRRETNGALILFPLIALVLFAPALLGSFSENSVDDFSKEKFILDSLVANWETVPVSAPSTSTEKVEQLEQLFAFNPNTATLDDLHQLGFSGNIASRILNYHKRGGTFHVKSDLLKIYGIDSSLYQKLYGYIQLPEVIERPSLSSGKRPRDTEIITLFDLNHGDSSQFLAVKGIGPVLAQRIIKYRNRLGGFSHSQQLYEVFGLDSAVVQELLKASHLDNTFSLRKINLNKVSEKELSFHPYISKTIAKTIVAYRFQHGAFNSVEEIRNVQALNEKTAGKLLPYLTTSD